MTYKSHKDFKYHIATPKDQQLPMWNDDKIGASIGIIAQFQPDEMWMNSVSTKFPKGIPIWAWALCGTCTTGIVSGGTYYYNLP